MTDTRQQDEDRKVREAHSDESIERAIITLREMTQERRGRGISAVMMLEEQIKALRQRAEAAERDAHALKWLLDQELPDIKDLYHQHPDRFRENISAAMKDAKP